MAVTTQYHVAQSSNLLFLLAGFPLLLLACPEYRVLYNAISKSSIIFQRGSMCWRYVATDSAMERWDLIHAVIEDSASPSISNAVVNFSQQTVTVWKKSYLTFSWIHEFWAEHYDCLVEVALPGGIFYHNTATTWFVFHIVVTARSIKAPKCQNHGKILSAQTYRARQTPYQIHCMRWLISPLQHQQISVASLFYQR